MRLMGLESNKAHLITPLVLRTRDAKLTPQEPTTRGIGEIYEEIAKVIGDIMESVVVTQEIAIGKNNVSITQELDANLEVDTIVVTQEIAIENPTNIKDVIGINWKDEIEIVVVTQELDTIESTEGINIVATTQEPTIV